MSSDPDAPPGGDSVAGVWGDGEASAGEAAPDAAPAAAGEHPFAVGDAVRYRRGVLLGQGGMGQVHAARDERLRREVAVKAVADGAGPDGAARLAHEAWITAQLEHPGIVPVYDAGTDADGQPWYAMKLIRGRTLTAALADAAPDDRDALLRHLLAATQAVAYAHSRGFVHRDLKPDNILVGAFGETQVADWGLACRADDHRERLQEPPAGTPGYMSPEQRKGALVHRPSDVYSLGVVLHEVVTGRRPTTLAEFDGPPELRTIVFRALAPPPESRYPDAGALADDLARYLDGRRVLAHTYTATELLARLVRLWRAPLAVGGVALIVLAVVLAGAWVRTGRERTRALHAEAEAVDARGRAEAGLASALIAQARTAEDAGHRARAETLALAALAAGESPAARGVLIGVDDGPRPERIEAGAEVACDAIAAGAADGPWLCVRGLAIEGRSAGGEVLWSREHPSPPLVGGLPSGALFAWTQDGPLEELDPATGARVDGWTWTGPAFAQWLARDPGTGALLAGRGEDWFVFARGGQEAETVTPCPDRDVVVWPAPGGGGRLLALCSGGALAVGAPGGDGGWTFTRRPLPPEVGRSPTRVAAWDDTSVVVTTDAGVAAFVDLDSWRVGPRVQLTGHPLTEIAAAPEAGVVVLRGDRGDVSLWDPATGATTALPSRARALRFAPDGDLVLFGARRERWRLPARPPPRLVDASAGFSDLALHPDGGVAAGSRGDGTLSVWDLASGAVRELDVAPGQVLKDGAFAADGSGFGAVTAAFPGTGVAWFDPAWERAAPRGGGSSRRVVALADGRLVRINWVDQGPLVVSDGADEDLIGWPGRFWDLAVSPSHRRVVLSSEDERVVAGELADDGALHRRADVTVDDARMVAIDDAGSVLVAVPGGGLELSPDGALVRRYAAALPLPTAVALSPDGALAAAGDLEGRVALWDRTTGTLLAELRAHTSRVSGLVFRGPDELLTAGWDATMRRWSLASLRRSVDDLQADLGPWALSVEDALAEAGRR